MRRNLYFYLYPVQGSFWAWHLERLRERRAVFNGRRIVVVARDRRTAPMEDVRPCLAGLDAEVLEVRNSPRLWETAHFLMGLERLRSDSPREITFYAHGKGAMHRGVEGLSVQSWCHAMYRMCLSSVVLIERLMNRCSALGCFRHKQPHGGSDWHYSGNFFWFKHSALFGGDWRSIQRSPFGVEGYLGRHISVEQACALTPFVPWRELYARPLPLGRCVGWLRTLRRRAPSP
jgi:hypothetical protein